MKQRVKTAVVILNWNGKSFLKKFLPSVTESLTEDTELWVADNGSSDDSLDFLKSSYPDVKTLVLPENYGFAGGYNKALAQIDAEYYLLLNSDIEVDRGWLKPLVGFMDANADYHACQPKLLAYNDPELFEYAGASGGHLDYLGFPFCRGRVFSVTEKDSGQYDDISDVFWATGAALMVRSSVYHKLGGLDELFFAHMEEIDLCWRIWTNGGKISVVPQSVVYHVGGGSLPRQSSRKTYLNFRNNHYLIYKNYPKELQRKIFRKRFIFDFIAAVKFALGGHLSDFFAVFRARRHFKQNKSQLVHSGATELPQIIYKHSIVRDFYLKGKKKYSDLDLS
ncbi:MAG: hypothetical protein C0592_04150 [Marinilabiliales bacterium]|nr:MAG: hypothetical protein C0592_04150 [Marinilabiliales bacterium]